MEQNPFYIILCLIVLGLGVLCTWHSLYRPISNQGYSTVLGICATLFLCIFAFYDSDYYHYLEIFQSVSTDFIYHVEDVYIPIALFAKGNYTVFRACVWGVAVLLAFWTFRRLDLPFPLVVLCFLCLIVLKFGYGRVSLALSIATFGLSYIVKPAKFKILSYLFGIVLILLSTLFHSSAIVYVVFLLISMVAINAGRGSMIIFLVVYLLSVLAFQRLGSQDIFRFISGYEETEGAISYLEGDFKGYGGIGPTINMVLGRLPFFIALIDALIIKWKNLQLSMPSFIRFFVNLCIVTVLGAILFLFGKNVNTYTLYYRFLYFAMLPIVIMVCYCIQNNILPKLMKFTIIAGVICSLYNLMYASYCAIVG